jgi:hypothetical protein
MTKWYDWIFDASKREQVANTLTVGDVEQMADESDHSEEEATISYHIKKHEHKI